MVSASLQRETLEHIADMTRFGLDHDVEVCAACAHKKILADAAREVLSNGGPEEHLLDRWTDESSRRWQQTKFYQLWVAEKAAGRNPRDAFDHAGWTA